MTQSASEFPSHQNCPQNTPSSQIEPIVRTETEKHIFIRATKVGDLNLDGNVSISDFIDLASHFGGSDTWQEGDLNNDGQVTISDFIDLASNFNSAYSGQVLPTSAGDLQILSNFAAGLNIDASVIGSAVPEPGIFGSGAMLALMLNFRRRKNFASR